MFEMEILIGEQPKKHNIWSLIIIILLLIIFMFNTYTYDNYKIVSYNLENQTLKVLVPENIEINEKTIIQYQNKKYTVKEIKYLSSQVEYNAIYKELLLKTDIKTEEEIITIKILNNKQRIITKIINAVKEN